MKTSLLSLAVSLTAATPAFAAEGDEQSADSIVVTAPRLTATDAATEADEELSTGPDGAAFIARQPGAAVVANGARRVYRGRSASQGR